MEIPTANTEKYRPRARKIGEPRSQREELIDTFLEHLNAPRTVAGFRPLPYGKLAKLFKGKTDHDLSILLRQCEQADNFGRLFWFLTKPERNEGRY